MTNAVGLWRGELLADVHPAEWLDFERIRVGARFTRAAIRAGELLAANHQLGEAEVMAKRTIASDRWNEAAYRLLASIHLERGDRSAARRILDHLERVLEEIGARPEPGTEALIARCHGG